MFFLGVYICCICQCMKKIITTKSNIFLYVPLYKLFHQYTGRPWFDVLSLAFAYQDCRDFHLWDANQSVNQSGIILHLWESYGHSRIYSDPPGIVSFSAHAAVPVAGVHSCLSCDARSKQLLRLEHPRGLWLALTVRRGRSFVLGGF